MKLFDLIKTFSNDESGAVTVDWVVLTAAIVGLGIAVIAAVSSGVTSLGGQIDTALSSGTVDLTDGLSTTP
jgi:Flp pilus assembly pilin Flp